MIFQIQNDGAIVYLKYRVKHTWPPLPPKETVSEAATAGEHRATDAVSLGDGEPTLLSRKMVSRSTTKRTSLVADAPDQDADPVVTGLDNDAAERTAGRKRSSEMSEMEEIMYLLGLARERARGPQCDLEVCDFAKCHAQYSKMLARLKGKFGGTLPNEVMAEFPDILIQ